MRKGAGRDRHGADRDPAVRRPAAAFRASPTETAGRITARAPCLRLLDMPERYGAGGRVRITWIGSAPGRGLPWPLGARREPLLMHNGCRAAPRQHARRGIAAPPRWRD